jgi:DNA-binding YbaB/EbfC family protein
MNFKNIMKQAQEMQAKMAAAQDALAAMEIEGQSGAGMVKVVMSGKGELKSLSINPEILKPEEVEILEDLIIAAVNDARTKADEKSADVMAQVTSGMPLPDGMKLPF